MTRLTDQITITNGVSKAKRVEYNLQLNNRNYDIYFASDQLVLNANTESALALSVLGAMHSGRNIRITDSISATFVDNQRQLIDVFTRWFPTYKKIMLVADNAVRANRSPSGRVGSFFTGGR